MKYKWLFVQRTPNSVTGIFTDGRETVGFSVFLNDCPNVAEMLARK